MIEKCVQARSPIGELLHLQSATKIVCPVLEKQIEKEVTANVILLLGR